ERAVAFCQNRIAGNVNTRAQIRSSGYVIRRRGGVANVNRGAADEGGDPGNLPVVQYHLAHYIPPWRLGQRIEPVQADNMGAVDAGEAIIPHPGVYQSGYLVGV